MISHRQRVGESPQEPRAFYISLVVIDTVRVYLLLLLSLCSFHFSSRRIYPLQRRTGQRGGNTHCSPSPRTPSQKSTSLPPHPILSHHTVTLRHDPSLVPVIMSSVSSASPSIPEPVGPKRKVAFAAATSVADDAADGDTEEESVSNSQGNDAKDSRVESKSQNEFRFVLVGHESEHHASPIANSRCTSRT
jgi:hypothetical protein